MRRQKEESTVVATMAAPIEDSAKQSAGELFDLPEQWTDSDDDSDTRESEREAKEERRRRTRSESFEPRHLCDYVSLSVMVSLVSYSPQEDCVCVCVCVRDREEREDCVCV
jgi:hypothetical protein